jgi:hypothetical protein
VEDKFGLCCGEFEGILFGFYGGYLEGGAYMAAICYGLSFQTLP